MIYVHLWFLLPVPLASASNRLDNDGMESSMRQVRELALQALFAFDAQQDSSPELADQVIREQAGDDAATRKAIQYASGAWEQRKQADEWAQRLAPQWPTHRQPAVDRALLRLAIWEMTNTDTPAKVVIDESIELARQFSTENSPAFVNGVLDAVFKEVEKLKAE
ncbi:MAG: transcription antitermination factor NusB [Tepidisphaeraceae bacterium]